MKRVVIAAIGLSIVGSSGVSGQLPESDSTWSFAAVGDVIMNRRLSPYDHPGDPTFHDLSNLIRGADVAFMNLEQSLIDLEYFDGWAAAESGGGYTRARPDIIYDLLSMGFDLFNRANNHTTDYGVEGMRQTDRFLDNLGVAHAGTGEDLGWASRPAYFDSPKGRFALVGMASTYTEMSRASMPTNTMRGRPGVNALRLDYRNEASPATLAALRNAARSAGAPVSDNPQDSVRFFRANFYPGEQDRVVEILNDEDRQRVLSEVRNAVNQSDHVIVNSHTHEPLNRDLEPPEWLIEFTHQVIDAGASAFVVEGPHQLRGVEIYNGRPIFYSLGNFIFQNETIDPVPGDSNESFGLHPDTPANVYYDTRFAVDENGNPTRGFPTALFWYTSVVAVAEFEGKSVSEIRFYPIELGRLEPRHRRGTPRLAGEADAVEIIARLATLSRPYGTEILYEDGIGVWRRGGG